MAGKNEKAREAKALEIRGSAGGRFLGRLCGYLTKVVGWTLRVRIVNANGEALSVIDEDGPRIFAVWHNSVFIQAHATGGMGLTRKTAVLISASRDGSAVTAFGAVFGYSAVRGSSSRRARAALIAALRTLKAGMNIGITPDGPRGPRYVLQPGVIKLAQLSGVKIIPLRLQCSREWRLNSWDRFRIPVPFSKVVLMIGEGLDVPRQLDDAQLEGLRSELERRMRQGLDEMELVKNDDH